MRSPAGPPEERPDTEVERLRRSVAGLSALERQLRSELEVERGSHEADVARLEAEIEAQGARLADSDRQTRELRARLTALHSRRARSIRNRIARLPPVARLLPGRRRATESAGTDLGADRPRD